MTNAVADHAKHRGNQGADVSERCKQRQQQHRSGLDQYIPAENQRLHLESPGGEQIGRPLKAIIPDAEGRERGMPRGLAQNSMPRFIAFHLPFFIIYSVSLFIRISRRLLKSGYSVDIARVNDDRRGHAIHNRNGNGATVAYSGALLFEHRRLRPLARLDALDWLILLRRNFALDLDLLVFDQAPSFVCLFRRRVAAFPRRRRFRDNLCTGISQFALHPRFAEVCSRVVRPRLRFRLHHTPNGYVSGSPVTSATCSGVTAWLASNQIYSSNCCGRLARK